ncbi:murein hydrolase activator EnvC family protein [Pontibaca methylaminivorans]|uniref:Septal ring factor EnvC, activator of murein hydrolases AmiA and AmiB n=1 Tax=Pontibaca methylaminivorans TaxID=515897 RepID=A0A1R3WSF0_9RHOB|nr:peptidoglycan DD-metalloendopeptidase family protein [Pontibaca methylaminivorans]SIT80492.1 Septal ring factor EnvC, activator of murein hydrolases AmiA and AmiB [Pontibaca methylaminivorans]
MRLIAAALLVLATTGALQAQGDGDPGRDARLAMEQLESAIGRLEKASSASDRVRALTGTVRAFESGLGALRDGLRRTTARERALTQELAARDAEIGRLLGVLLAIETAPPPALLLHPAGPLGSARSAMMLTEATPALHDRAAGLRRDLDEVQTLQLLQRKAVRTLEEGLAGIQQARAELSQAITGRTALPRRFTEDPVRTAILISSTETLGAFADGLSEIARNGDIAASRADISAQKGTLPLPVEGNLLHAARSADAAGITRDGIVIATQPRALVVSPVAATIRYRGPLLDLGNVIILEPQAGLLFVLSGLAEVYGDTGEIVPAGTPVGLMGGEAPQPGSFLSLSGESTGTGSSESLYMEVRENGEPVDPESWFRTDKDG